MRDDDDDTPMLTEVEADEVMTLIGIAAGEHIADEPPLRGDVDDLVEHALGHRLGACSLWVENTMLNLSMCPDCGSVSLVMLARDTDYLHGFIEVVEHLRDVEGLGGDTDEMLSGYRRISVLQGDEAAHAYVASATYWLDFDEVEDRVMHTTRALSTILDEVTAIIAAAREHMTEVSEED